MNSKTTHLLWFMYRFPKRYFKLGMRLNLCFDESNKTLKTDQELLHLGLTKQEIHDWRKMDSGLHQEASDWLADPLNHLISYDDDIYPAYLRTIKDPPLLLFCRSNCSLFNKIKLAVVGSRSPSYYGKRVVQEWVGKIATYPIVIVSGFAYGIDYLAHQTALAVEGSTIAVLGSGLINIYPKAHAYEWSQQQLTQQALMISEFPLNFPVKPWLFPYRNRIISGLSQVVLVVEARPKSGTLITARLAAEQGREVMAIPGPVHNPLSAGCHWLLQQGAALANTTDDVLNMLNTLNPSDLILEIANNQRQQNEHQAETHTSHCTPDLLECNTKKLLDCLEYGTVNNIEEILQRTGLDLLEAKRHLTLLEDGGWVQELVDGYARIK